MPTQVIVIPAEPAPVEPQPAPVDLVPQPTMGVNMTDTNSTDTMPDLDAEVMRATGSGANGEIVSEVLMYGLRIDSSKMWLQFANVSVCCGCF